MPIGVIMSILCFVSKGNTKQVYCQVAAWMKALQTCVKNIVKAPTLISDLILIFFKHADETRLSCHSESA